MQRDLPPGVPNMRHGWPVFMRGGRLKAHVARLCCFAAGLLALLMVLAPAQIARAEAVTFTTITAAGVSIPTLGAANPYPGTLNVSGLPSPITNLQVTLLGLTHTNPDDLDIVLQAPDGSALMVMSDACGTPDLNNVNLNLTDAAASFLPDNPLGECISGNYRPANWVAGDVLPAPAPGYANAGMSYFNGKNPNGTWRLFVYDDENFNAGNLVGWRLTVTANYNPNTYLSVETPQPNQGVRRTVTFSGWTLDNAGVGSGNGIDRVQVRQGGNCSGTILGQDSSLSARSDVRATYGLDASFENTGFIIAFTVPDGVFGPTPFTLCVINNRNFNVTASITRVILVTDTRLNVDTPPGTGIARGNAIEGWAFDRGRGPGSGPGVDQIALVRSSILGCAGSILSTTTLTIARTDVRNFFGLDNSYTNVGYSLPLNDSAGTRTYTICARSNLTGQYEAAFSLNLTALEPQMVLDGPNPDQALPSNVFTIAGWAFERSATSGSGINLIRAFLGGSCAGTVLGSDTTFDPRPDVQSAFGLPGNFSNTGFSMLVSTGTRGTTTFTVCARSSVTGQFIRQITRTVRTPDAVFVVDSPIDNQGFSYTLFVQGWAFDRAAGNSGPGVDRVFVYLGGTCSGTLLAESGLNATREDVRAAFGLPASYANSGFQFNIARVGIYNATFCFRSALTGQFVGSITRTVRVGNPRPWIDTPANGQTVSPGFSISGWAYDNAAGAGGGPGVEYINVYRGSSCSGQLLAQAGVGAPRPDVANFLGLDASYNNSGYSTVINTVAQGIPAGPLTFAVCPYSAVSTLIFPPTVRSVNVASGLELGTGTATATATPTATTTATTTATATPTATGTLSLTETATATPTATPTTTGEASLTPTGMATDVPTVEPTSTATETPSATPTDVPTIEPSATPTETSTDIPTVEPTATPTDVPTLAPTATLTATPTETPTDVPPPPAEPPPGDGGTGRG